MKMQLLEKDKQNAVEKPKKQVDSKVNEKKTFGKEVIFQVDVGQ